MLLVLLSLLCSLAQQRSDPVAEVVALANPPGCELERLLERFEVLASADPVAPELRRALCWGGAYLLGAQPADLCVRPALPARLEHARALAARHGRPDDRLHLENEYARILSQSGDVSGARATLEQALEAHPDALALRPESFQLLADLAQASGEWERTRQELDRGFEALELARAADRAGEWTAQHAMLEARLGAGRAAWCTDLGLLDRAGLAVQRLETLAQSGADPEARVLALLTRAELSFAAQNFSALRTGCEAALAHDDQLPPEDPARLLPDERARLRWLLGRALAELARDGDAAARGPAATLLAESLADPNLGDAEHLDAALALAELAWAGAERERCRAMLERATALFSAVTGQLSNAGGDVAAGRIAALHSRFARNTGAEPSELARAREGLRAALDARLAHAQKLPLVPGGVGALHYGSTRDLISELVLVELALDPSPAGHERALDTILEVELLGTNARRLALTAATVASARQRLLGPGQGVLLFLPALERSHLFAFDRESIVHLELRRRDELVQAVRGFERALNEVPHVHTPRAQREAELRSKSELLLEVFSRAELRACLARWSGFYTLGLGLFGSPALEALAPDTGRTLGTTHAICQLPSLTQALWSVARTPRDASASRFDYAVLAGPLRSQAARHTWPELDEVLPSEAELRALESLALPGRSRRLLGGEATLQELLDAAGSTSSVLEIFAHGVQRPAALRPAAILLSPSAGAEEYLDCDAIETALEPPSIVALYACCAALGPARLGDDTAAQLAESLLVRGARVALASRRPLAYPAMLELACAFHDALSQAGTSPGEALRQARARLAASSSWSDPCFHGNVSMYGAGLAPLVLQTRAPGASLPAEPDRRRWLGALALGVAGVLAAVALRRRRA